MVVLLSNQTKVQQFKDMTDQNFKQNLS